MKITINLNPREISSILEACCNNGLMELHTKFIQSIMTGDQGIKVNVGSLEVEICLDWMHPDYSQNLNQFIQSGMKVHAIKTVRYHTGLSLMDSKNVVEYLMSRGN